MVITGVIAIAGSFVVALVYTMWASAGAVTDTHCRVWNWLPSFSAVIGHSHISAALWRSGITVLFLFRIGSALLYHKWHTATGPATLAYTLARAPPASTALPSLSPTHSLNGFNNNGDDAGTGRNSATFVPDSLSFAPSSVSAPASTSASALVCGGSVRAERLYTYLNWVHSALIVVENVALAELSFITSKDSGATHEALFGLFVLCGTANMFVQLALFALKPLRAGRVLALCAVRVRARGRKHGLPRHASRRLPPRGLRRARGAARPVTTALRQRTGARAGGEQDEGRADGCADACDSTGGVLGRRGCGSSDVIRCESGRN